MIFNQCGNVVIYMKNVKHFLRKLKRKILLKKFGVKWIKKQTDENLLSFMRHEAHRIEKAYYNGLLVIDRYKEIYLDKAIRISIIAEILIERDSKYKVNPTVLWAKEISASFDDFETLYVEKNSKEKYQIDESETHSLIEHLRERRSCRVWSKNQPSKEELENIANILIDSARWAPNSGNRQPWRFKIFTDQEDKQLFLGIKERHTVLAPLLIFIGMDKRLYGAFGKQETCLYIDAGAAIENMITTAQYMGYGTCWNHFGIDFIKTRKKNIKIFNNIKAVANIPEYIEPVAILAVGYPDFIPPVPARTNIEDLIL